MRCNRNELAKLFGYDVKTIDGMVKKGMPYVTRPGEGKGRSWVFDTVKVMNWLTGNDLDDRIEEAELRLRQANAGLKQIEYALASGEAVHAKEIFDEMSVALANFKSRLLAMPGRLSQIIAVEPDPAVVTQILEREIDGVLSEVTPEKMVGKTVARLDALRRRAGHKFSD